MTTSVVALIKEAEGAGVKFRLDGNDVKVTWPEPREAAAPIIARLREHRMEVRAALARIQQGLAPPAAPANPAVVPIPKATLQARMDDCERRFGSPALALLNLHVRTPRGSGRVVQAFGDRLAVDLGKREGGRPVVNYFSPAEVEATQ